LFLTVIALPIGANLAGRDGADPGEENREMAPFPRLDGTWSSVTWFPGGLSLWFEDHFGFRSTLVRWYGETRFFLLNVSPVSTVVKGPNGWLFYADDGAMEDYTRETPLSPEAVTEWRQTIVGARDWLHERGIAYVFTIAPDKHVVYPEQLPATVRPLRSESRTDQVFEALAEAGVAAVDPRPALFEAKPHERLYKLTDTHWNDRGAFIAYQQIIAAVRAQAPEVPPAWPPTDFTPTTRVGEGQDLAGMIGLKAVLRETDLTLVPRRPRQARVIEPPGANATVPEGRLVTEIPGSTLPRAVVFRDSFGSQLTPFLSEHFSRVVYLWQTNFNSQVVLQERPSVVIQEIAGRHFFIVGPRSDIGVH
jgi:hypothetical protein